MPRKSNQKRKQKGAGVSLSDVAKFIKDNKLISRGLGFIPHPAAQAASQIAAMAGLGRKKAKRKQTGRGIFGDIGSGIGSVFGGLGSGVGSIAHGLFGAGRHPAMVNVGYRALPL
jgi:hypothetical protein